MKRRCLLAAAAACAGPAWAAVPTPAPTPAPTASAPQALAPPDPSRPLTGELAAHDPTLWVDDSGHWIFSTGRGLARLHSRDGLHWQRRDPVFTPATRPAWWAAQVPAHPAKDEGLDVWAPKVFAHGGRLWLAYSISTFGKNTSAMGLASTPLAAGPGAPAAQWRDDGLLLASREGDDFNAIDPDVFTDAQGALWLAWGSWWQGLRAAKLDPATLRPQLQGEGAVLGLAHRRGGIEAPTLVQRPDAVYLLMSWGLCCKGVDSTYEMRVGRAPAMGQPFVDRAGRPLMEGGGSLLLAGPSGPSGPGARWFGPGHQDVHRGPAGDTLVWHAYDAAAGGQPRLRSAALRWGADGWPLL